MSSDDPIKSARLDLSGFEGRASLAALFGRLGETAPGLTDYGPENGLRIQQILARKRVPKQRKPLGLE